MNIDIIPQGSPRPHLKQKTNSDGSIIIREGNELFVKLPNNERRKIGILNLQNRTLEVKRIRNKHLHNKSNSYGFNYFLIHEATLFDHIVLRETNTYKIPVQFIKENGKVLNFKRQNFEIQAFVSLGQIEGFRVGDVV